jgi:hypothetical protein
MQRYCAAGAIRSWLGEGMGREEARDREIYGSPVPGSIRVGVSF